MRRKVQRDGAHASSQQGRDERIEVSVGALPAMDEQNGWAGTDRPECNRPMP